MKLDKYLRVDAEVHAHVTSRIVGLETVNDVLRRLLGLGDAAEVEADPAA